MTFRIFVRQFNPGNIAYVEDKYYPTYTLAASVAEYKNRHSDLNEYSVVPDALVQAAYQETECAVGEGVIPHDDEEKFDLKWMDFLQTFITFSALAAMGRT